MLKCYMCKELKDESNFAKRSSRSRGYQYNCRECATKVTREWRRLNKDKQKTLQRTWKYKKYGIDQKEFESLLKKQLWCCAICKKSWIDDESEKEWHIDHNHTTNQVRGILCPNCNLGLGSFKDNILSLESAIKYLQKDNT